jgi:hypothetical protein
MLHSGGYIIIIHNIPFYAAGTIHRANHFYKHVIPLGFTNAKGLKGRNISAYGVSRGLKAN